MSEWQDKSDFEVNKAVAETEGFELFNGSGAKTKGAQWVRLVPRRNFNPCNNPSDAWPIIVENQISIFNYDHDLWSAQKWIGNKRIANEFIRGGSVLRAAMIVYLEMNGVKP